MTESKSILRTAGNMKIPAGFAENLPLLINAIITNY